MAEPQKQPSAPVSGSTVIHALRYGGTLCKKLGVPAEWEPNHRWVSASYCDPKEITCPECLAAYRSTMKVQLPGWRDDDPRK